MRAVVGHCENTRSLESRALISVLIIVGRRHLENTVAHLEQVNPRGSRVVDQQDLPVDSIALEMSIQRLEG